MPYIVFTMLSIIWGTTWIAIKITLEGLPPFLSATLRFIIAIAFLSLFALLRRIPFRISRADYKMLLYSAFFMYIFDYGFVYWGEQYLSAGVTAIFFATFPIFIGIFSNFIIKSERITITKILGIFLGFAGVFIIFYDQLLQTKFSSPIILATIAVVLGAAGGAFSTVLVKQYLSHISAVPLTIHQMFWGAVFLGALGFLRGETTHVELTPRVMYAAMYLGAIGSALAFGSYYWLLQRISALTVSFIIYITPVLALYVDYLVFHTEITWQIIVGSLFIFAGITVSQWESYYQWIIQWRTRRAQQLNNI